MSFWQRLSAFRSSTGFITAVVCYAVFVDQIFFAFILPILPYSLPERNGIHKDRVQYWTTIEIVVFGVACLVSCPLMGWWTDRHASRRLPFLASLLVLLTSTLIMWLTRPLSLQIFSRVLQGMADAMIYVVGMTIILDTVTTKHVAEYMGHVTIAFTAGTFAGPLLGGAVFDKGGYHAAWGMMAGFVALDTVLRLIMVEKKSIGGTDASQQAPGSTSGDELPVGEHGRAMDVTYNGGAETRSPRKLPFLQMKAKLPDGLALLTSPRMLTALLGVCVQSMVFSGFETVLSIYVEEIWNFSALGAGLIFIPLTIPAFFAPLLGRIVDRTSPRWSLVAGFLGMCPIVVLVRFVTYDSLGQKALLCFFLFMIGLGVTLILGPLLAEISHVAEDLQKRKSERLDGKIGYGGGAYAQAYALSAVAWSVGNIAGPLMCGIIKDEAGWRTMCWTLGLISGVTAIPCFIWSGKGFEEEQFI